MHKFKIGDRVKWVEPETGICPDPCYIGTIVRGPYIMYDETVPKYYDWDWDKEGVMSYHEKFLELIFEYVEDGPITYAI